MRKIILTKLWFQVYSSLTRYSDLFISPFESRGTFLGRHTTPPPPPPLQKSHKESFDRLFGQFSFTTFAHIAENDLLQTCYLAASYSVIN